MLDAPRLFARFSAVVFVSGRRRGGGGQAVLEVEEQRRRRSEERAVAEEGAWAGKRTRGGTVRVNSNW
ncbi:hypothetical protein L596_008251 [Steinernema carpocapsae]|uniref:Uncharacterized protein n=1 Tax=Steinernema carpocapsae TaxID=34508 RepID=A0A4U5PBW8_STECR|nr:hypothetical protein L596_008251 [Steinernema carpocapsae]